MKQILSILCLFIILSCGEEKKVTLKFAQPQGSIEHTDEKPLKITLEVKGQVDSVSVVLNNEFSIRLEDYSARIHNSKLRLGENVLIAKAYKSGKQIAKKYLLFHVKTTHSPSVWKPEIIRKLKHETDAFTQGLFFHKGKLYETTGERGHSRLMIRDLKDGKILKSVKLANRYFGEGATIYGNKVHYLTWTSGEGFIFDAETLQKLATFNYARYTQEGWGLTTIANQLVMSNGTEKLLFFDAKTMQFQKTISVLSHRGKEKHLNELEYDGTFLYANVWLTNEIMVINPQSGRVEAIIDCTDLVKQEKIKQTDNVLNGIAYNPKNQNFYLTGKNWEHIYEVRLR